jgi:hypothetical protein
LRCWRAWWIVLDGFGLTLPGLVAQAPAGATVAVGPDANFAHGYIVNFTPTTGGVGGLELLAGAGDYLYTLRVVAKPDTVSRPAEEQLLRALLARR